MYFRLSKEKMHTKAIAPSIAPQAQGDNRQTLLSTLFVDVTTDSKRAAY
jgi:hypothetical protein